MKYTYTYFSDTGQKRTNNEDYTGVFEINDGLLAVVCDGLGGNIAGEIASRLTVESIHSYFNESNENEVLAKIKGAIINANKVITEKANNEPELKGMATTAEVLFLKNNNAYWGHVGDSRIYLLKNRKLKQLTKDHSLIQKLVDEGYLTLNEAENHPNKNIIMHALGDEKDLEIELSKIKLNDNDDIKFFVCSDGVNGVINDRELEDILNSSSINSISETLSDKIEDRGSPDNYSFVIIEKTN